MRALIALGRLAALSSTPNFSFPELGQSGRPFPISGPFDGDSANTNINISGTNAKVIAESPRGAIVEIPKTVVGPNNIVVNDNGNTSTGNFRVLKIDLTAPKTSLLKGESTELHVEVQGLQGITQPVPVQLQNQTPSNINLSGGNTQNIVIQPSQVTTGGTFNWSGTVTGTGTGGFNITGTIPAAIGSQPTPTATPTSSPQTTTGKPAPSASPSGPSSGNPNAVPIGATAADLKRKCDELRKKLADAKAPCDRKTAECERLAQQLKARRAEADRTQADYDKKKSEFDEALQNFLMNLIAAARAKGYDTKLSLKQENKNYVPLKLADGVVIYFDASGIEGHQHIDNLADALRRLITRDLSKENNLADQLNQLKKLAAALAKTDEENKKAIAARKAAKDALDTCAAERDALCPKVRELEAELDKCKQDADAQAEAEKKQKEQEAADQKAAENARNAAAEARRKRKEAEGQSQAEKERADREAATRAEAEAVEKRLCEFCAKYLNLENSSDSPQTPDKLQELGQTLANLNDALEKIQTPAQLAPYLEKLASGLQAAQAGVDLINQTKDVIKQIKNLQQGGNDPAKLGKFLKLASGILDNAAKDPVLKIIAVTLNGIGELFSGAADLGEALDGLDQIRAVNGDLRTKACAWFMGGIKTAIDNRNKANGDFDQGVDNFIDSQYGGILLNNPSWKEKTKRAVLAKLRLCCVQKILRDCGHRK